jgi:serine/threonine-protein kinase
MAIVSSGSLMDALRRYELLPKDQLNQLPHLMRGRCDAARPLACYLVQRGWLTVYQMNQLLAEHGHELALGPYHILDRLGQGGQSLVYKARHTVNNWEVALKVMRTEMAATPEAADQFLQEMEAMARLDHPNVVQFCDADVAADTFYCAMEYVEGTDLCKNLRLKGQLTPMQAAEYVRQTALGLQHAYENNLIHRDIKPQNLYLTTATPALLSRVIILDWGLACLRPPGGGTETSNPIKTVIGTADYLSPEQARNANRVDIRGDIYSLGCTLYYLLTGQPPFPGGSLMQKLLQHQQAQPAPVESFRRDVPQGLVAVMQRMMAKLAGDRYQTPAAVALALRPFCRADQTAAGRSSAQLARPKLPPAPTPRQSDTPLPGALRDGHSTSTPDDRTAPQ